MNYRQGVRIPVESSPYGKIRRWVCLEGLITRIVQKVSRVSARSSFKPYWVEKTICLAILLILSQSFLLALPADAQVTRLPAEKEKDKFVETPAQRFIENIPPTANLPSSKDRSTRVPAFLAVAPSPGPAWTALGPFPIPNGQTENRVDPVSGRVSAIAVDPSNPRVAYVGTAQGGLYRTLNGGITWTQLMDNATSPAGLIGTPLAIGAVTID